jgi:hypothetical protein
MSDRQPPKAPATPPPRPVEQAPNKSKHAQTLPLSGVGSDSRPRPASPAATPRSTFSRAPSEPPKAPAPRSAFPRAPSSPVPGSDTDKTVKRPYPSAWDDGAERHDEAPPVGAPQRSDVERTVRVQRSVFAATLAGGAAPEAAQPPAPPPGAEPLRMPSTRPTPSPFEQARGARQDRTLLMPGSVPLQVLDQELRALHNKRTPVVQHPTTPIKPVTQPTSPKVARAPSTASAATASGAGPSAPTLSLGSVQTTATNTGGAPEPTAAPPRASMPGPAAKTASLAPPRAKSAASSGAYQAGSSEPLRLQLAERDILPELATTARPEVRVSRAPWIAAAVAIVVVLAGLVLWMQSRSASPSATPTAADGVRSSAVLAATPTDPAAAAPASPTATALPNTPAVANPTSMTGQQPSAQTRGEAQAARAEPAASAPTKARAGRIEPSAEARPSAGSRSSATAARQRAQSAAQPVLTVSAPPGARENIEDARAALKALEASPASSDKAAGAGDTPLAPPGDTPVLRLSPSPSPTADEAKPEAPPPAPEGE